MSTNTNITVKISEAAEMITALIKAKLVPMVTGSPGIGKSQIIHAIANEYGLKVIDLRLAQADPTDLLGFPHNNGKKAGYLPMETFPIEGDPIPEGYNGWLLFLDEFNSAKEAVQAAAYKLILDKMVGIHKVHPKVAMVCAGNKDTDGAIVNEMSTALQSRLIHIEVELDVDGFIEWAQRNGIDHKITDYLLQRPTAIYTFKPDHVDKTYACPRTWEFADRIIKVAGYNHPQIVPLLAGAISEGVAREFYTYTKVYDKLPKIKQVLDAPDQIVMPQEPSVLYALTGTISSYATPDNLKQLMRFIDRMPTEFQVFTLRDTIRRQPQIGKHPSIVDWQARNAKAMF